MLLYRNHMNVNGKHAENDYLKSAIRKALTYLHHHFSEPLTLEVVAKDANMSAGYLTESFRKSTGTSFQTHLQLLRLRFAQSLLQASDLPITDICFASGFWTLSHFERVFKERFGQTPRAFCDQNHTQVGYKILGLGRVQKFDRGLFCRTGTDRR